MAEKNGFRLATADDLSRLLPAIKWLWRGWLPCSFVVCIVGESGIGKSQLALALVKSLITDAPFPDGTPSLRKPGKVVWCDTESAQAILSERIQKWNLPAQRILMPGTDALASISLSEDKNRRYLRDVVMHVHPTAFVVDSLVGSHGGEENSSRDMTKVLSYLATLARDATTLVLALHHLRKAGMNDGSEIDLDRVRGSGAITSFARVVIALDQVGGKLRISVVKNNLAKKPDPLGMTITNAGVTFGSAPSLTRKQSPDERAEEFLKTQLDTAPKSFKELSDAAAPLGISKNQLYGAYKRLDISTINRKWTLPSGILAILGNGNKEKIGKSKSENV